MPNPFATSIGNQALLKVTILNLISLLQDGDAFIKELQLQQEVQEQQEVHEQHEPQIAREVIIPEPVDYIKRTKQAAPPVDYIKRTGQEVHTEYIDCTVAQPDTQEEIEDDDFSPEIICVPEQAEKLHISPPQKERLSPKRPKREQMSKEDFIEKYIGITKTVVSSKKFYVELWRDACVHPLENYEVIEEIVDMMELQHIYLLSYVFVNHIVRNHGFDTMRNPLLALFVNHATNPSKDLDKYLRIRKDSSPTEYLRTKYMRTKLILDYISDYLFCKEYPLEEYYKNK